MPLTFIMVRKMSYIYFNPNPLNLSVGDCTIRAYGPYMMARGYSGTGSKEEILQELHEIVENASDERVKNTVLECVSKMENMI